MDDIRNFLKNHNRAALENSRQNVVIFAAIGFNFGYLAALNLWLLLLIIPTMLFAWIASGIVAGAGINFGSLLEGDEVNEEIERSNSMINKIAEFIISIPEKFSKEATDGRDSSDDVHAK